MGSCEFFSSDEWGQRLEDVCSRNNNVKMSVWTSDRVDDTEDTLQKIVEATDHDRSDLSEADSRSVFRDLSHNDVPLTEDDGDVATGGLLKIPESCPHEAVDGTERCEFHMSPEDRQEYGISDDDVRDKLLDTIRQGERHKKIFTGAKFGELDLENYSISAEDNFPIRLDACRIEGELDLGRAVIDQPLFLNAAYIGSISCRDAEFVKDSEFNGTEFAGKAEFTYAKFVNDAEFWNVEFDEAVTFYASSFEEYAEFRDARFHDYVNFKYARVERDIEFWDATFEHDVTLESMTVDNAAEFRHATFGGETSLEEMRAREYIDFKHASFDGLVDLYHLNVGGHAHFWGTEFSQRANFEATHFDDYLEFNGGGTDDEDECAVFRGDANFRYSTFEKDVEFWCVTFHGDADFRDTTFRGTTEFQNAVFHGDVTFEGASHQDIDFSKVRATKSEVELIDNDIPDGVIEQPQDERTQYDLSRSEFGEVALEPQKDKNLFAHFKFYRTDFNGFDFPDHRRALNKNWSIHEFDNTQADETDPDELETTYLKAKNGAGGVGDTHAASEFFVRERRYQRKSYFRNAIETSSLGEKIKYLYRWGSSWLYNLTCGYGERPFRTIAFGFSLIGLFSILYIPVVDLQGPDSILSYVTFSVQTFVALLIGGVTPTNQGDLLVQFLTAFEAFIGGFAIALFVFSLTKSIQR